MTGPLYGNGLFARRRPWRAVEVWRLVGAAVGLAAGRARAAERAPATNGSLVKR